MDNLRDVVMDESARTDSIVYSSRQSSSSVSPNTKGGRWLSLRLSHMVMFGKRQQSEVLYEYRLSGIIADFLDPLDFFDQRSVLLQHYSRRHTFRLTKDDEPGLREQISSRWFDLDEEIRAASSLACHVTNFPKKASDIRNHFADFFSQTLWKVPLCVRRSPTSLDIKEYEASSCTISFKLCFSINSVARTVTIDQVSSCIDNGKYPRNVILVKEFVPPFTRLVLTTLMCPYILVTLDLSQAKTEQVLKWDTFLTNPPVNSPQ